MHIDSIFDVWKLITSSTTVVSWIGELATREIAKKNTEMYFR